MNYYPFIFTTEALGEDSNMHINIEVFSNLPIDNLEVFTHQLIRTSYIHVK
jgi:hypothetical protein